MKTRLEPKTRNLTSIREEFSYVKMNQMNTTKQINVNFSSLVGLKAELLRKQAEVNDVKSKGEILRPTVKLKTPKGNKSEKKPSKLPKELIDIDDLSQHKKSRLMLEAKSRMYENLKKSRSNSNPLFLVDFTSKDDDPEDDKVDEESVYSGSEDDDDWVEYTDCFGRTRKCLKEDLPRMKEKDRILNDEMYKEPRDSRRNEEIPEEEEPVIPREPEIEIMRRKWEEQTQKLSNQRDIHYQDVLFDEARSHGVGYFTFAQDEEERAKQQENLAKLRKETEQKQKEAQEARELRNRMEQNRLKAARIRQRIRAGLPPELTEEEIAEINAKYKISPIDKAAESKEEENEVEIVEERKAEKASLRDIEDKVKAFGELLGKRNGWYEMSQEEWVDKRRKVRDQEFAPVYKNFRRGESLKLGNHEEIEEIEDETVRKEKDDSSLREDDADVIGPLPPEVGNEDASNPGTSGEKGDDDAKALLKDSVDVMLNSDSILAGLKFLREKFEEKNKT